MKHRGPQPDVLVRLFDEEWQQWEISGGKRERLPADAPVNGSRRTLAVPARHVLASPLWIEGTDPALTPDAAKLELEVRGLLSRAQGMEGVSLRLHPGETRTLAVAAVFPPELPEGVPGAERFDGSPFLLALPPDAATLWREGEDYVVAFTRGRDVVYWETADRSLGGEELRTWLRLITLRLEGEGVLDEPPRVVSLVEGLPADRFAPAGSRPSRDSDSAGSPALENLRGDWKPVSAHEADAKRKVRERMRSIVLAVAAGYLVLAAILFIYAGVLRWQSAGARAEAAKLRAAVDEFQPTAGDWNFIAPTAEPALYPLALLRGVIEAMPPDGVRLTKFNVEGGRISIDGEAPDFAAAKAFYNSLASSPGLKGIVWDGNTTPTVTTVTSFHAEGALPSLLP